MDEMQLISEMRGSTPVITDDAEALARTRLLATLDATPSRAKRRPVARKIVWRTAIAGALAATVAIGFTVAQNVGAGHESVANAAVVKVLDNAATAAAARPFTAPRPDQWVYQRFTTVNSPNGVDGVKPVETLTDTASRWVRASGRLTYFADPGLHHNKLTYVPYPANDFPPQDYATLSKLPVEPSALLGWLAANRPAGDRATDFQDLSAILRMASVLPPRVEVAIYRAIKRLPGVTIRRGVKDLRNRSAIGIIGREAGSIGGTPMNEMVLLDPVTYAFLGSESILGGDVRIPPLPNEKTSRPFIIKAGTVNNATVILRTGIVDKVGQQP